MSSSSSSTSSTLLATGIVASFVAVALTAAQSDAVSRRWLSAKQLQAKRTSEYKYRWNQALAKAVLRLKYNWSDGKIQNYSADDELLHTHFFKSDTEIDELCEKIVSGKLPNLRIVRIGKDDRIDSSRDHFIWLVDCSTTGGRSKFSQISLTPFASALADKFESRITTATFAFVGDASAQTGSRIIVELMRETQNEDKFLIIEKPLWMACLAALMEQRIYSSKTLESALFALCRLEALRRPSASTVLITLPGQATIPQLLPLVQTVFPDDRHIFCYTGCIQTTQIALQNMKSAKASDKLPASWDEALSFNDPVAFTTPLSVSNFHKSTNLMLPYPKAIAALPLNQADATETWMAAVDAYFALKEDERRNGYLPYVCKIDYLYRSGTKKDQYWALRSLLQYVTGSRSREFPTKQLEMAEKWMQSFAASERKLNPSEVKRKEIENAVFQHKLILIENKTLKDTVQPAEHWTLKAAVKRGCACCLPEEDEEEESNATTPFGGNDTGTTGLVNRRPAKPAVSTKYIDGKTSFAFDPTKFG